MHVEIFERPLPPAYTLVGIEFSNGTADFTMPAGAAAGDLAVAFEYNVATSHAGFGAPSGWNNLFHETGVYGYTLNWKILDAADISGGNFTKHLGNAAYQAERVLAVFRGSGATPNVDFMGNFIDDYTAQAIEGDSHHRSALRIGISAARTNAGAGTLNTDFTNSPDLVVVDDGLANPCIHFGYNLENDERADIAIQQEDAGYVNLITGVTFHEPY